MGQDILRAGELWKMSDWSVWLKLDGPLLEDSGLMHTQRKHSTFYIHLANEHTDTSTGPADMICKYTGLCAATVVGDVATRTTSIAVLHDLGSTTASQESFSRAREWLESCKRVTNHSLDQEKGLLDTVPLRLVEIGDDCKALRLKAVSQLRLGICPEYATLSYCWGGSEAPWKTLRSNVAPRETSMVDLILPATIQDALKITYELGLRHVWIDALCIVQDDSPEWALESAKMGSIYSHCVFNIAANIGGDSHSGCFNLYSHIATDSTSSPPRPFDPHLLSVKPPTGKIVPSVWSDSASDSASMKSTDMVRVKLQTKLKNGQKSQLLVCDESKLCFYNSMNSGPLSLRAWVYQEQILSPRILHYTETQLYWQCSHSIQAEDGLSVPDPVLLNKQKLRTILQSRNASLTWSIVLGLSLSLIHI